MIADVVLHELQLVEHLLAAILREHDFRADLRLVNVLEAGCLDLILLVMHSIGQVQPLASLLTLMLLPLVDGAEFLVALVELGEDVWLLSRRLILFEIILEFHIACINVRAVDSLALLTKLAEGPRVRNVLRRVMLGVSFANGQEIIAVDDNTAFLHDTIGALGT